MLAFTPVWASPGAQRLKNPPAMQEMGGSNSGLGKFSAEGHGNPLQYSCLENPMDKGAWQATVYRVTRS